MKTTKKTTKKPFVSRAEGAKLRQEKKQEVAVYKQEVAPPTPDSMLFIAVKEGRSLEEISKLMDMHDRWRAKIAKGEFVRAKSGFLLEVPRIEKKTNVNYPAKNGGPNINYNYAELGEIGEKIKQACFNNGLSYGWDIDDKGPKIKVTCILYHVGGHEITTQMEADADVSGGKTGIHAKASTITYLQRHTLIAVLGLTTANTDDDGRGNTKMPNKQDEFNGVDILPSPSDFEFNKIIRSVIAGTMDVAQVENHFHFSEEQLKALNVAQDARKSNSENN